jgi:hypothetical protein
MKKNSIKNGINKTKILIIISIILLLIIFLLSLKYSFNRIYSTSPDIIIATELTPEIISDYSFQNIVTMTTNGLGMLPAESKNIFACNDKHRDPSYWLVFELPIDKVTSFIEEITKTQFETLVKGISSEHSFINDGPVKYGGEYIAEDYWNLNDVKNGSHYEKDFFYCGIDIDRCKIFFCCWSM